MTTITINTAKSLTCPSWCEAIRHEIDKRTAGGWAVDHVLRLGPMVLPSSGAILAPAIVSESIITEEGPNLVVRQRGPFVVLGVDLDGIELDVVDLEALARIVADALRSLVEAVAR